jgi:hypothetical protein
VCVTPTLPHSLFPPSLILISCLSSSHQGSLCPLPCPSCHTRPRNYPTLGARTDLILLISSRYLQELHAPRRERYNGRASGQRRKASFSIPISKFFCLQETCQSTKLFHSTSPPTLSSPTPSQPSKTTNTAPPRSNTPTKATSVSQSPSYHTSPLPMPTSHPTSPKPTPSATMA